MRALSIATVFVAAAGYLVIWIASKALPPAGYVDFMVFWGLFFALTGLVDGLMQETARGVTTARHNREGNEPQETVADRGPARPFALAGGFALAFGLLSLVSAPLWAASVSPEHPLWAATLTATGLASFAFQAILCGLISAASRWREFAWLIAIDSGIRLLLAALAWWLGWGVVSFFIITVIGAGTWAAFALLPGVRPLLGHRADIPARAFVQRGLKAMLASGANAVLITGFPVLLRATTDLDFAGASGTGEELSSAGGVAGAGAVLAGTITAVTLTRAPLLVPLQRFQPALIVHFTKHREQVLRAAATPALTIIAIGAVGGVAAYLVGRPIMALLFDEAYLVSPAALGLLTFASTGTALLMVTGSAALATGRHDLYWFGWAIATVAAVGLLLVDTTPELRSVLALGIGPLVGVALQLWRLQRLRTRPSRAEAGEGDVVKEKA